MEWSEDDHRHHRSRREWILYVFATRIADNTAGVVCIDTTQAADIADPFCGFTPLSAVGDAPMDSGNISGTTNPVVIGAKWYAFNEVPGTATGTEDTVLCFDLVTHAACGGQPFALSYGGGSVFGTEPISGIAAAGTELMIQVPTDLGSILSCFDATTNTGCAGSWPVTAASIAGAPFPMLSASGVAGAISQYCPCTRTSLCKDKEPLMTETALVGNDAGRSTESPSARWPSRRQRMWS